MVIISVSETILGATGIRGPTGFQGEQGPTGAQGPTGFQGEQGPTGAQGPTGFQGEQGITGPIGEQGITGLQGPTGLQGEQGPTGFQGAQGITGLQGPTGLQGEQGITGPIGEQGITGLQGMTGVQGATGWQGTTGIPGSIGMQGPVGNTGVDGPQGPIGEQGITGPMGITGYAGVAGNALLTVGPSGTFQTMQAAMNYLQTNAILDATVYVDRSIETGTAYIGMTGANVVVIGGTIGQNGGNIRLGGNVSFIGTKFTAPVTSQPTFTLSNTNVLNFTDCDIELRNDVASPFNIVVSSDSTRAGALSMTNCNINRPATYSTSMAVKTCIDIECSSYNDVPATVSIEGCTINSVSASENSSMLYILSVHDSGTLGPTLVNIKNNTIGISGSFNGITFCRVFECRGQNKIYNFDSNIITVSATGIPTGLTQMVYDFNGNTTRCPVTILNGTFLAPSNSDKVVFVESPVTTYRVVCSNLATNVNSGTAFTVDSLSYFTPLTLATNITYVP